MEANGKNLRRKDKKFPIINCQLSTFSYLCPRFPPQVAGRMQSSLLCLGLRCTTI